jgi:hypothetical protein
VKEPFYFRPPEYRYSLRSEAGYGWWTGVVRGERFWIPERWLGIEDMPDILAEYFTAPAVFLSRGGVRAEDALAWRASEDYVFHCGCNHYMSGRGDVESS